MWDKMIIRVLGIVYLVGGGAALFATESVGKFIRWFADRPRYIRLDGILGIVLGAWLLSRERYRVKASPPSWRQRILRGN